ncbi:HlyIII-domain-containing protein [Lentinus brumalis]|uniref:HlyIII-domain-containing protein n=1 Tax=Lentinus brumalis TaxID=2498619 RepID=A0A371D5S1_9APHY|nr:HlyIII-domain-containing protein [Polyporus brumalis]
MMSTTTTAATSTTATTTAIEKHAAPDVHLRRPVASRRRFSTFQAAIPHSCHQLPPSIEALDLSLSSPAPTLASLRHHVLSYLADLEARLSLLESAESLMAKGEVTIEEARDWARDGLEMLRVLREDVCSHLPDMLTLDGVPSVEEFVSAHTPDLHNLPDMCSHLPDMPDVRSHLPDFKLPDVRSRLDDVRSRISDIDFNKPLSFVPTLSARLQSLQAHLSSTEFPSSVYLSSFAPSATLSTLLEKVMSSHLVADLSSDLRSGEETLEKAAIEIARAMKRSLNGSRLIQYVDLPQKWRNNPFVKGGYRFIPLHDWPRLILSLFALHNETLNIHTHLIPFLLWSFAWFRFSPSYDLSDTHEPAQVTFTVFALLCLFTSALWHTMAGCAHPEGMELCARVDYVGIGWLISASVGTLVYYGFQCQTATRDAFLLLCLAIGIAGSILPFTAWFNMREYKNWRIAFFLTLAFSGIAPLAELSRLHSFKEAVYFISPIAPSLVSYIVGLLFYATHFPECVFASRWPSMRWLDFLGGGSHAIWHVCIVLAISFHKQGMQLMRGGIGGACPS